MKQLDVGIDLLVLNPQLPGVIRMLQMLRGADANFKVVAIGKIPPVLATAIHPQANLERPSSSDSISRLEWLTKVRKLLKVVAAAATV
ncbi:MAG TPA: hypothetical protein VK776_13840 [Bryobacteraceae bacterium]|nr:hypothetical protein [Bryobacteraceae bacterium]